MSGRTWFVVILLCFLLLCGCNSPPDTAVVIRVIDGDTITVEGNYRVRYIGIDTPEMGEAFGLEAW